MLFLCYWEVNENMPSLERVQIAKRLVSTGLFPPPGVKILRWDETPDAWGVVQFEAESATQAAAALTVWRAAGAGFFKSTKTAPAFAITAEMMDELEALSKRAQAI